MNVLQLDKISPVVDEVFGDSYTMSPNAADPVGIILRSFSMHEYTLPESVLCVARAGAGVNNIPIDKYTEKGVVVFNTPGANANAVKELVIAALLLSCRKIEPAMDWVKTLKGKEDVAKLVEKGKGQFVGAEIAGKTIGIIGLGAIGALVANVCIHLGMSVVGFDPYISIDAAWSLNNHVRRAASLDELYAKSDFITMHIPYSKDNKGFINAETIAKMKDGAAIINLARGELVDNPSVLAALKSGKLARYVTDFPTDDVIGEEGVVAIPHLGASTPEAEDNCARMAAQELVDYVENGNINNSVNFGKCVMPRSDGQRVTIIHKNLKGMLTEFTDGFAKRGINIANLLSQARGDYAYTILDLDGTIGAQDVKLLASVENVVKVRIL